MKSIVKIFALVGLGAFLVNAPWNSVGGFLINWYNTPSSTAFQEFFVSDAGTAYSADDFKSIGGVIGDDGSISGSPICPETGSTNFQRIVGRLSKTFWGTPVGFEPASEYQAKIRIRNAKGSLDWNQFFKTAEEVRNEDLGSNKVEM